MLLLTIDERWFSAGSCWICLDCLCDTKKIWVDRYFWSILFVRKRI